MTNQPSAADSALLGELRSTLTHRGDVPPEVFDAGYAAYTWRTVDAELAAILFDSASRSLGELTGVRSEQHAAVRAMTFGVGPLTIEVEIGARELLGQVHPAEITELDIEEQSGQRHRLAVDDVGGFSMPQVPTYPFRLIVRTDTSHVVTSWVTL